jgi:hypothetical protein
MAERYHQAVRLAILQYMYTLLEYVALRRRRIDDG